MTESRRDRPWVFRTYSGHSSAQASNELYRTNLGKGQTGLSVAFDLPTQTGYDADHPLARGEVGKVGVPISHIDDMSTLFEGIPLDQMNTSMTINATAAWLLALYAAAAERQGVDTKALQGTTQNDIVKEYLSRGTYVFPPEPSLRMISDMVAYTVHAIPKWNPINICSYHLQEAGATPVQEVAYSFANAIAVLDAVRDRDDVPDELIPQVFSRISFFLNSGIRFVEEICKARAMTELWDQLGRERYGVEDPKLRRFRYGVQVNSLGLTEAQPENNVIRIVLESLGVTFSKKARCRALQLPAWNEALGLPRPWDQQWSLRIQQILAYETDLLEYGDLFDGSKVVEARTAEIAEEARVELEKIEAMGGVVAAVENAYMKQRLVESHARRVRDIESGDLQVVGVNCFTETAPSPLTAGEQNILKVDPSAEHEQIARLEAFRSQRNDKDVAAALQGLKDALANGENVMPPSIRAAHAGVTTGEWADTLRNLFGEYRAPTGVAGQSVPGQTEALDGVRARVKQVGELLGRPLKILVGKPGLDGHSNGAEQIAVKARDVGMEVVYDGIRLTPEQIVQSARDEGVHVIGLSILSGSHGVLVLDVMKQLAESGLGNLPVVVGGIIPDEDADVLREAGVRRVYTPKDFDLTRIMSEIADVVAEAKALTELARRLQARDAGSRDAVAEALNLLDDRRPARRHEATALLDALVAADAGATVPRTGITGAPGAGKSTLLDALVRSLREQGETVGIVAVDPSSQRTGGALLGDRFRVRSGAGDPGVFIRSMAARSRLGGLAEGAWGAVTVLSAVFDRVFVETVGVGQSESEVANLVDTLVFVAQPGAGDVLQFMKAGVLELPDLFVVNKFDMGAVAERTLHELEAGLGLGEDARDGFDLRVIPTSARDGDGIDVLLEALDAHRRHLSTGGRLTARRRRACESLVLEGIAARYGSYGLDALGGRVGVLERIQGPPRRSPPGWLESLGGEVEDLLSKPAERP